MSAIKVNGLTKKYKDVTAVDNISLNVDRGEIFGFVGQNGAGKSTTIRILLNMIFPTDGNAEILGCDCVKDTKRIKSFTSYVPGEVTYYKNIKVGYLLNYAEKLNGITDKAYTKKLCDYFELDLNRKINELSTGNRKKISIVQALIKKPEVIILDEPTNGLDPLIQDKLFHSLIEEKERGCCIFLSSHNLFEVEDYCDRVAVIKKGRILKTETMDEIKSKQKFKVIYTENKTGAQKIIENYSGDVNSLLKKLSEKDIKELEIKKASLHEEFMQYYEENER